jgi:hypothetical protein
MLELKIKCTRFQKLFIYYCNTQNSNNNDWLKYNQEKEKKTKQNKRKLNFGGKLSCSESPF